MINSLPIIQYGPDGQLWLCPAFCPLETMLVTAAKGTTLYHRPSHRAERQQCPKLHKAPRRTYNIVLRTNLIYSINIFRTSNNVLPPYLAADERKLLRNNRVSHEFGTPQYSNNPSRKPITPRCGTC